MTATTATEPIIHGAEIKKGVYVAHLGNNEVDEELILRADKVVIDDWETDKHRMGGPGYEINGEFAGNGFRQNDLIHETGVLSMARTMAPNSAGSQFFVMVAPAPHLDGQYAAFGKITEGQDVAIDISRVQRNMMNDMPKKPVVMATVRVDTQGVEYPAPETH